MSMVDYSMFVEETGQDEEVESYCERCHVPTLHTIISRYGEEIRRVRCNICEDVHVFQSPSVNEEMIEVTHRKKTLKAKPTWDQVMSKNKKEPKSYHVNEVFNEMDIITHPSFGVGFVSQLIGYDKIEVSFETGKRILIHNRLGRPITLPGLSQRETTSDLDEDELFESPDEFQAEDPDFDEFLGIEDDDLLLGEPTKLSPQAWAALHEEDEEEKNALEGENEESSEGDEPFVTKTTSKKNKERLAGDSNDDSFDEDEDDDFFDEDEDDDSFDEDENDSFDEDEDDKPLKKKKKSVARAPKSKKVSKKK